MSSHTSKVKKQSPKTDELLIVGAGIAGLSALYAAVKDSANVGKTITIIDKNLKKPESPDNTSATEGFRRATGSETRYPQWAKNALEARIELEALAKKQGKPIPYEKIPYLKIGTEQDIAVILQHVAHDYMRAEAAKHAENGGDESHPITEFKDLEFPQKAAEAIKEAYGITLPEGMSAFEDTQTVYRMNLGLATKIIRDEIDVKAKDNKVTINYIEKNLAVWEEGEDSIRYIPEGEAKPRMAKKMILATGAYTLDVLQKGNVQDELVDEMRQRLFPQVSPIYYFEVPEDHPEVIASTISREDTRFYDSYVATEWKNDKHYLKVCLYDDKGFGAEGFPRETLIGIDREAIFERRFDQALELARKFGAGDTLDEAKTKHNASLNTLRSYADTDILIELAGPLTKRVGVMAGFNGRGAKHMFQSGSDHYSNMWKTKLEDLNGFSTLLRMNHKLWQFMLDVPNLCLQAKTESEKVAAFMNYLHRPAFAKGLNARMYYEAKENNFDVTPNDFSGEKREWALSVFRDFAIDSMKTSDFALQKEGPAFAVFSRLGWQNKVNEMTRMLPSDTLSMQKLGLDKVGVDGTRRGLLYLPEKLKIQTMLGNYYMKILL